MAFNYTKPAHETKYAGCLFRSRLEATWAAFFDVCGIPWVYEPFDLPGWSPDFLIGGQLLAEVKPISDSDDDVIWKIGEAAVAAERKEEIVLLGASPEYMWKSDFMCVEGKNVFQEYPSVLKKTDDGIDVLFVAYMDMFGCDRLSTTRMLTKKINKQSIRVHQNDWTAEFNEAKNRVRFSYSK